MFLLSFCRCTSVRLAAVFRVSPRGGGVANAADVEAAPSADAAAAAAALGQAPQPANRTGTLGSVASGGYDVVELQPQDPVPDAATTIAAAEDLGAAARAAEAADGAARCLREAANKRAADAAAAQRAGTLTRAEAAAEVEAALKMPFTPEAARDAQMMRSPMDEAAKDVGFSLPLSFGEARSAAALLFTPQRTPGQNMVFVDRRTLGATSAVSDMEEYGTPEEIPTTPKSTTSIPNPVRPLMFFGETDSPGWGTGGLDELALGDQVVAQAKTAAAAVSALMAANLATEDPPPAKAEATSPKKKGAAPKKRGKWDRRAQGRMGREEILCYACLTLSKI